MRYVLYAKLDVEAVDDADAREKADRLRVNIEELTFSKAEFRLQKIFTGKAPVGLRIGPDRKQERFVTGVVRNGAV